LLKNQTINSFHNNTINSTDELAEKQPNESNITLFENILNKAILYKHMFSSQKEIKVNITSDHLNNNSSFSEVILNYLIT